MTDIASNSSAQSLVIDSLNCVANYDANNRCLDYDLGYHHRENGVARAVVDAPIHFRLQPARGNQPFSYLPIFTLRGPSGSNLQGLYFQGLSTNSELRMAAVTLSALITNPIVSDVHPASEAPVAPVQFDRFLNFILLGSAQNQDEVQLRNTRAIFEQVFSYHAAPFHRVQNTILPFIHYNAVNLSAVLSPDMRVRLNITRDWFALRRSFEREMEPYHFNANIQNRILNLFKDILSYAYFNSPELGPLQSRIQEEADILFEALPSRRANLFEIFGNVFSRPLPFNYPSDGNLEARSNQVLQQFRNIVQQERSQGLSLRFPFDTASSSEAGRLSLIQRFLANHPLRSLLQYRTLENPRGAILESKLAELSRRENLLSMMNHITSRSNIQVGHLNAEWFTANGNARLREVLESVLFAASSEDVRASLLLQNREGQLPSALLRIQALRERVQSLVLLHPSEANEYYAACLGVMIQLYGNGNPIQFLNFTQAQNEFRLPLTVESRTELNAFYREIAIRLGASNASSSAQSAVQWASLALCVAGGTARVAYNTVQDNWDGRGDGVLAASGIFCGYALGSFGADLFGGSRSSGRVLRNNTAGLIGAALFGTAAGLLPMLIPAGPSSPPSNMMMPPIMRPLNARNPNTPAGCPQGQGCGP